MFLTESLNDLTWHSYRRVPGNVLPPAWRNWILDRGSLTQRLKDYSQNHFSVQVISQAKRTPLNSERLTLKQRMRQACIIREVALLCYDQPAVYARSVIPLSTLRGKARRLACLGNKPLGAFLFQYRQMSRGPLEIAPFRCLINQDNRSGWGRRSVFYLNKRPLLVSEFFLPHLINPTDPVRRPGGNLPTQKPGYRQQT